MHLSYYKMIKQPTDAVWREYTNMLYKLIPVAMGEDF